MTFGATDKQVLTAKRSLSDGQVRWDDGGKDKFDARTVFDAKIRPLSAQNAP